MAKIKQGILGGVHGKIGDMVITSWKGIPVVRKAPSPYRFSRGQIENQARFMIRMKFLNPLRELLNQTYPLAKKMTGFNKACSENKEIVIGTYPSFSIDYALVRLSHGSLPQLAKTKVTAEDNGKLVIQWDESGEFSYYSSPFDSVFLAIYCEEFERWMINPKAAARFNETYTEDLRLFSGKQVHVYVGIIGTNPKRVSDSRYLGKFAIS